MHGVKFRGGWCVVDYEFGLKVEARVLRERNVEVDSVNRAFFRGEITKEELADRCQRIRSETSELVLREETGAVAAPQNEEETNVHAVPC